MRLKYSKCMQFALSIHQSNENRRIRIFNDDQLKAAQKLTQATRMDPAYNVVCNLLRVDFIPIRKPHTPTIMN